MPLHNKKKIRNLRSVKTQMLQIAVCDDEKVFIEKIKKNVSEYFDRHQIEYKIDTFISGNEFVELKEKMKDFDIVFMDIDMDGLNGIETAREMRKVCPDAFLIFVTAFINYTLEGYKVEAIRYVLKDRETLADGLAEALDAVMGKMNMSEEPVPYNFVDAGRRSVSPSQVVYVENNLHKTAFHLMEQGAEKVYAVYRKLNDIESDFDSEDLIRTHQSYLVNVNYVRSVERYLARLESGAEIPISKQRYRQTQEAFLRKKGAI